MNKALQGVLDLLDLETIEVNMFRGLSPKDRSQRVFGGQVLAQALTAANRTVDLDRRCHSLHAYFILAGDPKAPILYSVDRTRDGGSFTTRRITAVQHGRPIFHMEASFQVHEDGLTHQFPMPETVTPESLPTEAEMMAELAKRMPPEAQWWLSREQPIEMRPIDPVDELNPEKRPPYQNVWLRTNGTLPDDSRLHQCLLAYASDMTLLDTCMLPHGISWHSGKLMSTSLDHAMWFHTDFRIDDWMLYTLDSPASGGARGFNRGLIYTRSGTLCCSVVQEGLIRLKTNKKT